MLLAKVAQVSETLADDSRTWLGSLKRTHMLFGRLVADIDRRLPRSEPTPTVRRILVALKLKDRLTDAQLATALGMDRAQLSREMKTLISEGLVAHSPSPTHKSQRLLSLHKEGVTLAVAQEAMWTEALQAQFHNLSPREQRLVASAAAGGLSVNDAELDFNVEYRTMQERDLSWILDQAVGSMHDDNVEFVLSVLRNMAKFLRNDSYARFGVTARVSGNQVGSCMILPVTENDLFATINCWFVHPSVEHRGVRRELLYRCIEHAKKYELSGLIAFGNVEALATDDTLRGLGFKRDRTKVERSSASGSAFYRKYELRAPF